MLDRFKRTPLEVRPAGLLAEAPARRPARLLQPPGCDWHITPCALRVRKSRTGEAVSVA